MTGFVASSFLTIFLVLGFIAPRSSAFVSGFGDRVRSTMVSTLNWRGGIPTSAARAESEKRGERHAHATRRLSAVRCFPIPLRRRERRARIITAQNLPTCPKPRDFYAVEAPSQLHPGPWKRRRSWNSARDGGSTKMVVDGQRW
jgi:hypothetical protein